jgi:hypothetical protein
MWDFLLAWLWLPKLGHVRITYRAGSEFEEDLSDGIVWVAYDVRQDAIERHWRNHDTV